MKTKETVTKAIKDDYDREAAEIQIFDTLVEAFKPFEGKQITKRLETAAKKALPDYTIYYVKRFGMFHLKLWKENYNSRFSFLLGYERNPYYHEGTHDEQHSGFTYYSACSGFWAKERNRQRVELLANDKKLAKIITAIDRYKEAKKIIDDFNTMTTPSWYSILKAVGIQN